MEKRAVIVPKERHPRKRSPSYFYDSKRAQENLKRRNAWPQFETALMKAARGDPAKLREYLLLDDCSRAPLGHRERMAIADLIEELIEHKGAGARLDAATSRRTKVKQLIVGLARDFERSWHLANPGKPLPRGKRNYFINVAVECFALEGDSYGVEEIDTQEIRHALGRGKRRKE